MSRAYADARYEALITAAKTLRWQDATERDFTRGPLAVPLARTAADAALGALPAHYAAEWLERMKPVNEAEQARLNTERAAAQPLRP